MTWTPRGRSPATASSSRRPGVGHRGDRAGELARRGLRRAAQVVGRELGEPGEVDEPLGDLGRGGEQELAAQAEPLDQPVDVEVRARRVDRARRRAVHLEERGDPLARLGRDLGRLQRRAERRDHVELAPAGDLRAAREVDRAQLDRRAGERADHGAGVAGVGEQPQPGEQVADLRALEEGGRAREPVGDRALLQRRGDGLALALDRADEHADVLRRDAVARHEPLDVRGDRLRLRALVRAAPERRPRRAACPPAPRSRFSIRPGSGATTARGRGEDPAAGAAALGQAHHARLRPLGAEVDDVLRRRAAEARDRRVVVGRDAEVAVVGDEQPQQQVLGEVRVLELVDEDVVEARREPCADVRLAAQEPERVEDEVAGVERPALRQQPVVGGVDGGELALAHRARPRGLAVLRQRGGPGGVVRGGHQLVLEPVDPLDDRAEHARSGCRAGRARRAAARRSARAAAPAGRPPSPA